MQKKKNRIYKYVFTCKEFSFLCPKCPKCHFMPIYSQVKQGKIEKPFCPKCPKCPVFMFLKMSENANKCRYYGKR